MTIRLLRPFNGIPADFVVDLDRATEAALISQRAATAVVSNGIPYVPNAPFDVNPPAEVGPTLLPEWNETGGNTAVTFGDSIAITTAQIGNNFAVYDYSFFAWYQTLAQNPFNFVADAAVGGSTTQSCLDRIYPDVVARRPAWCVLHVGTNDIGTDVPTATIINNYRQILSILTANKIKVVVCSVIPYGPAYVLLTVARNVARNAVNDFLRNYCRDNSGLVFVDAFGAMIDPASATGAARADYTRDLLHPSPLGARAIGAAMVTALDSFVVKNRGLVSALSDTFDYDATALNRVSNPLFTGAGPVATSWNVSALGGATSTNTTVARSDGIGQNQNMVIVSGANNDAYSVRTGSISSRFTAGDAVYGEVAVSVSSATNLKGVRLLATHTANSVPFVWTAMSNQASTAAQYDQADWAGVIRTPVYVVPSGTPLTGSILTLDCIFGGVGGATVQVGRASWRRVIA
jgi:lysophospholipase L1-like esterase